MKLSTKLLIGLFVALILVILFYNYALKQVPYDFIFVGDGDIIPDESCEFIGNQVWVITKTGCVHCGKIFPILEEIEQEKNLEFKYINTAIEEQRNELLELGFIPQYVPSVVIDGKVYAGALNKEKYLELIK